MKKFIYVLIVLTVMAVLCSCTRTLPPAYSAQGKYYKTKLYIKTELNDCKLSKRNDNGIKPVKK